MLAAAISDSITAGLSNPFVSMVGGETVWDIFKCSLDAVIRDVERHPRGKLFRRLIEYGSLSPGEPKSLSGTDATVLSDAECGLCIEFIYSQMINRFKGELSKLLALESCIRLVEQLRQNGHLPAGIRLFWGETIQERRKFRITTEQGEVVRWGGYSKGSDGLLVELLSDADSQTTDRLKVLGVVQVKSMAYSKRVILEQISQHIERLNGGVKLGAEEWSADKLLLAPIVATTKAEFDLLRVMVIPSKWKLGREWIRVQTDEGKGIVVFPELFKPPMQTKLAEIKPNCWKITHAWSQEALSQAAYEMTFWYMSELGRQIYEEKISVEDREGRVPEAADCNSIKMMLYFILLRPLSNRQKYIATRLYNIYSFGYPLGADSKEMLRTGDFPDGLQFKQVKPER